MSETPPAGYRKLPDGTRCRCIRLWQDGVGGFYCCRSSATLAFADSLSQHCPNCEAQAAEIEKLEANINSKAHFIEAIMGHMDLQFAAGAAEERAKIVAWLRNNPDVYDWSPPTIAAAIIDEEHLDDRYQQGD